MSTAPDRPDPSRPSRPGSGARPGPGNTVRLWGPSWEGFAAAHRDWVGRFASGPDPVYHLPVEVVSHLARTTTRSGAGWSSRPLISAQDAKAELAFAALCRESGPDVVGVRHCSPIRYDLFTDDPAPLTREAFRDVAGERPGFTYEAYQRTLRAGERRLTETRHQLRGWAGRITLDPDYRAGLEDLRQRDDALGGVLPWPLSPGSLARRAEDGAPALPDPSAYPDAREPVDPACILTPEAALERLAVNAALPWGRPETRDETRRLFADAVRFLGRWELSRLVTWDLPEPQGPVGNLPPSAAGQVVNPFLSVSVTPSFFNLPPEEILRRDTVAQQKAAAEVSGQGVRRQDRCGRPKGNLVRGPVPEIGGRGGRQSENETAFSLWFFEHTVRRRYGAPRGLIARLTGAFIDRYGLSAEHVKRLLAMYKPVLRRSPRG